MRKELELQLVKKYPKLFEEYGMPVTKSCMGWGCTCDDGWYDLLSELCEKLSKYEGVVFAQVKEKFGGLRVYINAVDREISDEVYDILHEVERKSFTICEQCGRPGTLRSGGYLRTLCNECEKSRGKEGRPEGTLTVLQVMMGTGEDED